MKKKTKASIIILTCIALIAFIGLMISNPFVSINNHKLANSLKSIDRETVSLNDVVPF